MSHRLLTVAGGWVLIALSACGFARGDQGPSRPEIDLVYLADARPLLLRFHIELDGKPVRERWHAFLKGWFDFLDRDGDGILNEQELRWAPSEQIMLTMLRQGSGPFGPPRDGFRPALIDKKEGDRIDFTDFRRLYERTAAPLQLVAGQGNTAFLGNVNDALFKALDLNQDGKLSREELAAARALIRLDTDDDEYVSLGELSPAANVGNQLRIETAVNMPAPPDSGFHSAAAGSDRQLAALLLARYDKDRDGTIDRGESGLARDAFARLDTDGNGRLDAAELSCWHLRAPALTLTIRLGATGQKAALEMSEQEARSLGIEASLVGRDAARVTVADVQLQILRDESSVVFARPVQNPPLLNLFRQVDKNKQGFLTQKDLAQVPKAQVPNAAFLRQIIDICDRDGDGKMTEKELLAYVNLQAAGPSSYATLAVADFGRNLLQLLDANGDGRLSQRELLSAWDRLKARDQNQDGTLEPAELSRHLQLVARRPIQGGFVRPSGPFSPVASRASYSPDTPTWFRKMDRNGDGDVSRREFLGTRQDFDRFDDDHDGLLSPDEAVRAAAAAALKK